MKRPSLRFLATRRFWQRFVFALACVVTFIAAFYAVENEHGRAAWARYCEEARSRGVPLDWKEIAPAPIPEAENFVALPLFRAMGSQDPAERERAQKSVALPDKQEASRFDNKAREEPLSDFAVWQPVFVQAGLISAATDDPVTDVLRGLERYEPTFALLRDAAVSRPQSRLLISWDAEEPTEKILQAGYVRGGSGYLDLSRTLALRVAALLAAGRPAEALTDWRVRDRLSEIGRGEPMLLPVMLRAMTVSSNLNNVWRGLRTHAWTEAELQDIEARLGAVDLQADVELAFAGERVFISTALDEVKHERSRRRWFGLTSGLTGSETKSAFWRSAMWHLMPAGWIDQNRVRVNQWFDAFLPVLHGEEAPARLKVLEEASDRRRSRWVRHPYWSLADSSVLFLNPIPDISRETQGNVQLCRVGCALERFRLRTGRYPETLGELAPREMEAVPSTIFKGELLLYRRVTESEAVAYSPGTNGRDDGGVKDEDNVWFSLKPQP